MMRGPRILLAGGGTGGHVYPAVAIADALIAREPRAAVAFAGTRTNMEWTLVPRAGYAIHPISAAGVQRALTARNLKVPFTVVRGLAQSLSLVGDFDADLVVGTGGFVSGPVGLAGVLRGRPLVIQEQNAFPGQTNRILGRIARRVYIAFEEARKTFSEAKTRLTGNPVRADLARADRAQARAHHGIPTDARVILAFGGSLGSKGINGGIAAHLDALLSGGNTHLIWQTGSRYFERFRSEFEGRPGVHLMEYIDRMDLAYAASDVAVCRAGALTCSELMLTRTPAVLVPSPNVTEDHQTYNARSLADAGAAVLVPESELIGSLLDAVRPILDEEARRTAMQQAAAALAKPNAADQIADDILKLIEAEAA